MDRYAKYGHKKRIDRETRFERQRKRTAWMQTITIILGLAALIYSFVKGS